MANTYTWAVGNGDFSNPQNWSPNTIDLAGGATQSDDSLVFINSNSSQPYMATYGGFGTDEFQSLVINYAGADVAGNPDGGGGYQLTVDSSIQVSAGTLDLGDFTEIVNGGSATQVVVNGTLQGTGLIDGDLPAITGTGLLLASNEDDGTTLSFQNEISSSLAGQVASGATMEFGGTVDGEFVVTFGDAANGEVQIDGLPDFHGTIAGLGVGAGAGNNPGSFVDLTGVQPDHIQGISFTGNAITVADSADGQSGSIAISGNYAGDFVNYAADGSGGTAVFFDDTVCFAAGTEILTPQGAAPVEMIAAGDMVIAVVGGQRVTRSVKWVGWHRLALGRNAFAGALAPVRIKRNAIGEALPVRDLLVSPPHCLFLGGKLVPAKLLVNDMSIVRDDTLESVVYHHIELDGHALLIAEGVETESYLDTGNRAFFDDADRTLLLNPDLHLDRGLRDHPAEPCAPIATDPAAVEPIWRKLVDRAVALGFAPDRRVTTNPDLHLLADGRRIDPIAVKDAAHSFMVSAGVRSLSLVSRSVTASRFAPYLDDARQIGIAVSGVTIRGIGGQIEFAADDPIFDEGWHAPERAERALWRWTKGRAVLPAGWVDGPMVVEVMVRETTSYRLDEAEPSIRHLAA